MSANWANVNVTDVDRRYEDKSKTSATNSWNYATEIVAELFLASPHTVHKLYLVKSSRQKMISF